MTNMFLFQSMPSRFDLRTMLKAGERATWYATRYRRHMRTGDIAYFWMGGPSETRGLYGWGVLCGLPYLKSEWDEHGIDIEVRQVFAQPIRAETVRRFVPLADMLIFQMPQATNFLLEPHEAEALVELTRQAGETPPDIVPIASSAA